MLRDLSANKMAISEQQATFKKQRYKQMKNLLKYTITMKQFVKPAFYFKALCTLTIVGLISCSSDDSKPEEVIDDGKADFALWLQLGSWPNTTQYVVGVDDLTTGEISLEGNGDEVTSKADYGVVARDGFYYYPSSSTDFGKLTKFEYKDDKLQVVNEVPFTYQNAINSSVWVDENTLVFIGRNGAFDKVIYSIVNTTDLKVTNGEFALPELPEEYASIVVDNVESVNNKLFISFNFVKQWPEKGGDFISIAEIEYPSMEVKSVFQDKRTSAMGGTNMWEPASGVDESDNIYMLFSPRWAFEASNISALYKINNGEAGFDQSYFFNLTEALGGEPSGYWHIGNGKAIVKYTKSEYVGNRDILFNASFALIDVNEKSVIKKLALPLDKGSGLASVIVENGKAYIAVNAENEKDYVWEVDSANGNVKAGLEIVGGYDYILRIDNLK